MKKNYGVLALTCLAAVFTIFMVLTPGFAQKKTVITPTKPPVDVKPADLPEKFNQLKMGMTSEQVKGLLGWPATIRPIGQGKKEWKYFIRGREMGMTSEQVKWLLGWPATSRPIGQGKREWKYFIRGGEARLFLNFQGNKIVSLQQLTP